MNGTIQPVGFPTWISALLIGGGYFFLLRIITIKLQFGEREPLELSFNSIIYEPIQAEIFFIIDEIADSYLRKEINKELEYCNNLSGLAEKLFMRINNCNPRVLNDAKKIEAKQLVLAILNENHTSDEEKKYLLAKVIVTKELVKPTRFKGFSRMAMTK